MNLPIIPPNRLLRSAALSLTLLVVGVRGQQPPPPSTPSEGPKNDVSVVSVQVTAREEVAEQGPWLQAVRWEEGRFVVQDNNEQRERVEREEEVRDRGPRNGEGNENRNSNEVRRDGDARNPAARDLERELDVTRREIRELRAHGNEDEARNLEQRAERMTRRLEALSRRSGPEPGDRGMRADRGGGGIDPERAERIEHVRIAIQHLHAAGLHDVAGRLEGEIRERLQRERRGMGPGPGDRVGDDRGEGRGEGGPREPMAPWRIQPGRPDREDMAPRSDGDRSEPRRRDAFPRQPDIQDQLNDLRHQLEELRRRLDGGDRNPR